jgi:hypothetical protein
MNLRPLCTTAKWIGGILGYVVASLVVAIALPYISYVRLCNGKCDDAPGTGLFLLFLAALLLGIFLTIGFFLLIEILYCRIFSRTRIQWGRLPIRQVAGVGGTAASSWVLLLWPPNPAYRTGFESPLVEVLVFVASTAAIAIAIGLPFRFRRSAPAESIEDSASNRSAC